MTDHDREILEEMRAKGIPSGKGANGHVLMGHCGGINFLKMENQYEGAWNDG